MTAHPLFTRSYYRRKIDAGAELVKAGPFRAGRLVPHWEHLWRTGRYVELRAQATAQAKMEASLIRNGHWAADPNNRIHCAQIRCACRRAISPTGPALLDALKRSVEIA